MTATKKAFITVLIGLLLAGGIIFATFTQEESQNAVVVQSQIATEPQAEPATVQSLLKLVNIERDKVGVAPLVIDERLNGSAYQKSVDMNTNGYFSHVDKNGRHGYDIAHEYAPDICKLPSENILSSDKLYTAEQSIEAWMESKSHREAMLSPSYTFTGFGISGPYITQHFC